jgi:hypothetical protein
VVTPLLFEVAWAANVVCDDLTAAEMLAQARVEEGRAPVSHPELIPGLALASARTEAELRSTIRDMCLPGGDLSLVPAESFAGPDWSAYTFVLTRGEMRGCALHERTIAISIGVRAGAAPTYALRARMPPTRTPVGSDCPTVPRFRDESVLDGEDGPVRLVLVRDHEGAALVHAEVAVRSASADGWTERVLLDPAPPRLIGGGAGPMLELTDRFEEKWVVAHGDRTGAPPACRPIAGQTVWTPDGNWTPHDGADALRLLAERGLWRMAGEDGWFLIVAQDDEEDEQRLRSRARRIAKRTGADLLILESAWFPGLNPGFWIVTLPPWATEAEARAAREKWRPRRQAYAKQAWTALDSCDGG